MLDIDTITELHAIIRNYTKKYSGSEIAEIEKKIYQITSSHLDALQKIHIYKKIIKNIIGVIPEHMRGN